MEENSITIPKAQFSNIIDLVASIQKPGHDSQSFLLTTKKAADYLGCSTVTFRKIAKAKSISPVRLHKRKLFRKTDLDNYLNHSNHQNNTDGKEK